MSLPRMLRRGRKSSLADAMGGGRYQRRSARQRMAHTAAARSGSVGGAHGFPKRADRRRRALFLHRDEPPPAFGAFPRLHLFHHHPDRARRRRPPAMETLETMPAIFASAAAIANGKPWRRAHHNRSARQSVRRGPQPESRQCPLVPCRRGPAPARALWRRLDGGLSLGRRSERRRGDHHRRRHGERAARSTAA